MVTAMACLVASTTSLQTILAANGEQSTASESSSISSTAPDNTTPGRTPGNPSKPLEGRVEEQQEEALPTIEKEFRAGTKFDEAKLTELTPDNIWIQTPEWFGGKWHSEIQTINYMYDYKSGLPTAVERSM